LLLALIAILVFRENLTTQGYMFALCASSFVYISRNEQRKIAEKLSSFTCTLLLYSVLGGIGLFAVYSNRLYIFEITTSNPMLLSGGLFGAIFQFLLTITLVRHGNLNTNTFIQLSQILFGMLTKVYI